MLVSVRPMKVNELVLHLKISPYHPVIHILIELNGNKLGIHRGRKVPENYDEC